MKELPVIRTYFAKLGLSQEIADLYAALYTHGPQTISSLSRNSGVERTRIYRLIDQLLESHLIEIESHYKRGILRAAPIANLAILIAQKDQELKSLQDELDIIQQILARNSLDSPATRVQFYQGTEGMRQMRWNMLQAKGDILGYVHRIVDEGTGKPFMSKWAQEFEQRKLTRRSLIGDDFVKSWHDIRPDGRRIAGHSYHYIEPKLFRIKHTMETYDDVTSYYQWKDGTAYGIEIYSPDIASGQRQLLEILWKQSRPETRI